MKDRRENFEAATRFAFEIGHPINVAVTINWTALIQAGERNEGHCLNRSEAGREAYMRSELSRCRPGATKGSPFVAIWGRDVGAWMGLHTHLGIHWSWRHDPNRTALIALLVRICGSPARPKCEHSDKSVFAESICGGWQIKLVYVRSLLEGALRWTEYIVEQSEKHHLWPDIAGKAFGVSQAIGRAARSRHARFSGCASRANLAKQPLDVFHEEKHSGAMSLNQKLFPQPTRNVVANQSSGAKE